MVASSNLVIPTKPNNTEFSIERLGTFFCFPHPNACIKGCGEEKRGDVSTNSVLRRLCAHH